MFILAKINLNWKSDYSKLGNVFVLNSIHAYLINNIYKTNYFMIF